MVCLLSLELDSGRVINIVTKNNFFSFFTRIESVLNARAHSNTEQLKIVADLKNQTSEGGALEGSATQANKGLGD